MIKYITTALVLVLFGLQLNSTTNHQICEGIVPDNDLYIPPFSFFSLDDPTGITEEQFNAVIDKTEAVYKDIIAEMGGDLQFQRNWDDGTVNAFANREGDTWLVAMFGGLARHFTITEDAFMMVVCHELGHHIGGAPKYNGDDWASNEGQADYFAGLKCFRRVLMNENNIEYVQKLDYVDPYAKELCFQQFEAQHQEELTTNAESTEQALEMNNDIALCIRASMGGFHLAQLFKELRGQGIELDFKTPDTDEVPETMDRHPAPQCRMDTYLQGSVCNISYDINVDQNDEHIGTCNRFQDFVYGVRPKCWYKPTGENGEDILDVTVDTTPTSDTASEEASTTNSEEADS